jgi:hypothetical protein
VVGSRWYAVKPSGMAGISASACRIATAMPQGLGFAVSRAVHVHTTGNDGTERPTGPAGGLTG